MVMMGTSDYDQSHASWHVNPKQDISGVSFINMEI